MLLPREESTEALAKFLRDGQLDLGFARVERQGKAAVLLLANKRFLNSEDNSTQPATEIAADVCILDPQSQVAVLRGEVVPEGKYAGRRIFNAGINLTHLYYGKIPFLWFLVRDLGFVNKMMRGLARPEVPPDEVAGDSIEKLWISAVETFAIGGGCQILLATDFNIAGRDAYLTLPARKEGIIPAMANLRLARFVGDRIARQAIMYERRIDCDSETGRMICDEIIDPSRDGCHDRPRHRPADRLGRRGCHRQSPRSAPVGRATRHLPPLRSALRPRAGALSFQPCADLQPRAVLERAEPPRVRGFHETAAKARPITEEQPVSVSLRADHRPRKCITVPGAKKSHSLQPFQSNTSTQAFRKEGR